LIKSNQNLLADKIPLLLNFDYLTARVSSGTLVICKRWCFA